LEKEVANIIREEKAKEREENISRHVKHTRTPIKRASQRNVEKEVRVRFNNAWFIIAVRVLVNDSTTISR
jgi:hypothetical protein